MAPGRGEGQQHQDQGEDLDPFTGQQNADPEQHRQPGKGGDGVAGVLGLAAPPAALVRLPGTGRSNNLRLTLHASQMQLVAEGRLWSHPDTTTSLSAADSAPHTSFPRPWIWRTLPGLLARAKEANSSLSGSKRTRAFDPKSLSQTRSRPST